MARTLSSEYLYSVFTQQDSDNTVTYHSEGSHQSSGIQTRNPTQILVEDQFCQKPENVYLRSCESCGVAHAGTYGTGRFCGSRCAHRRGGLGRANQRKAERLKRIMSIDEITRITENRHKPKKKKLAPRHSWPGKGYKLCAHCHERLPSRRQKCQRCCEKSFNKSNTFWKQLIPKTLPDKLDSKFPTMWPPVSVPTFTTAVDSLFLPFSLNEKQAVDAFKKWNSAFFLHRNFRDSELSTQKLYVPFYVFDSVVSVDYTCEIGFIETVHIKNLKSSTNTEFETWSWRPIRGTITDNAYSSSLGIMQVYAGFERQRQHMNFIRSLDIQQALPFLPSVAGEAQVEPFVLDSETAYETIFLNIFEREEKRCRLAIQKEYRAEKIRNLRANVRFRKLERKQLYLPAFGISFKGVGGRTFQAWVNGRDGDTSGDRLYSVFKSAFTGVGISTSTWLLYNVMNVGPWLETTNLINSAFISAFSSGFLAYSGKAADKKAGQDEENFQRAYERRRQQSYYEYSQYHDVGNSTHSSRKRSYYDVLGLPWGASEDQIKTAFRKLAMEYHPDRQHDPFKKNKASERFREIANAYEVLKDRKEINYTECISLT
eukprot:jgi/Galph1/5706/GphlegSOOS_G4340.1